MKKISKILKVMGFGVAALAVMALLGFVGSMRSSASCDELVVHIHTLTGKNLVTETDVKNQISEKIGVVIGEPLNKINTRAIEEELNANPYVKSVRVYETINKKLIIELEERKPMVRLMDSNGKTAILDVDGYLMPLSHNAVLRLPVITGNFKLNNEFVHANGHVGDSLAHVSLVNVYAYASAIATNPFWKAQIQQTDLNAYGDFVAYPQVGKHTINFGSASKIEEKLDRLFIFYKKGLGETGWNKYTSINLKYKDQIVCTKK